MPQDFSCHVLRFHCLIACLSVVSVSLQSIVYIILDTLFPCACSALKEPDSSPSWIVVKSD